MPANRGKYDRYLGEYVNARAHRGIIKAIVAINDVLWGEGDAGKALSRVRKMRIPDDAPSALIIRLLVPWAQVANRNGRREEADALLRRAKSLLREDLLPRDKAAVLGLEGYLAAEDGKMLVREALYRQELAILENTDAVESAVTLCNFAHFLAIRGRETEVDAELEVIGDRAGGRTAEHVQLIRFMQYCDTGRFRDAAALLPAVESVKWDLSGHRAVFLAFSDLVIGRWRLLPDQGKAAGNHTTASDASELPLWAAVMDHLLAGRAQEALECARQEAGEDSKGCVTKTGFDSFNLIRAELANGNWQAAVRLIGLRRGRGNVNYLDDYFLAVACLIAGQRRDAVAHFARVRKACEKYNASGRLEFELRMACGLRAHDVYWLTDAAREREAQPASAAGAATQAATPAPTAEVRGALRLLGSSAAMEAVCRQIASLAPLDVPVLIGGETGSGKELVARALHEAGPRASHPFLAVNCGAISESLLESELFGHERGAFTGAVAAHRGLFEEAGGGTILLDEIGDTPARLQVSLLRVLETGEFRPVGSAGSRRIRCRVLAATNADLASLAATGSFRRDLFYRLKRLAIDIPPLRERGRDAAELAVHFLAEGRPDGRQPELSPPLADALCRAAWPGNVRELRNVMERARLLNSEKLAYDLDDVELPTIHPAAVVTPAAAADAPVPSAPAAPAGAQDDVAAFLHRQRTGLRRLDRLRELFARHGKLTRAEAAAILGVTPKTATGDLRALCAEGLVEKVMPSASRRTHYFRLKREE